MSKFSWHRRFPFIGRLCLWLAALALLTAYLPATVSADSEIGFKLKSVTLDGTKVFLHGEFVNEDGTYNKVTGLAVHYILSDEDGYPLLTGNCREKELDIAVGSDPVAHTIETENANAVVYSDKDIFFWRINSTVTVE